MPSTSLKEIFVKIARIGSEVREMCLNGDHTVEELLDEANEDVDEETTIRVNGKVARRTTKLNDGDRVTIAEKVSGGR